MNHCETGDCREILRRWIDEGAKVQMCVTSPPYWGLRDYGVPGQLGLESTPQKYVENMVEVFGLARQLLAEDGTLWLNLGDCYHNGDKGGYAKDRVKAEDSMQKSNLGANFIGAPNRQPQEGFKPKDLVGIPWAVAKALQAPYYTGRIKAERDRVWLGAMIDAEGTICGFDHDRADGGGHRSGIHIQITNSSVPLLDEATRIWPASRNEHGRPGEGHLGELPTFRWIVHGIENKLAVLRELYPYLIAKRQQAVVAYSMLLLMADAKRLGHSSQKDSTLAKRALLTGLLSDLNHQRPVVMPDWLTEPPSLFEPGWYLRQDIIWSKPNPMPESVRDRCTKSHEYLFLLSKNQRYYYDADAIAEPVSPAMLAQIEQGYDGSATKDYAAAWAQDASATKARILGKHRKPAGWDTGAGAHGTIHRDGRAQEVEYTDITNLKRNRRSVWTVTTQPYPEAHFATFPPALIEPCILAGSRPDDIVLDPFMGSGTTAEVAQNLGRRWLGCELNPAYIKLQDKRTAQLGMAL